MQVSKGKVRRLKRPELNVTTFMVQSDGWRMQGLAMSVGIFRDRHDRRKKKKSYERATDLDHRREQSPQGENQSNPVDSGPSLAMSASRLSHANFDQHELTSIHLPDNGLGSRKWRKMQRQRRDSNQRRGGNAR